ncbi:MAG: acyl-CoA dehydratase activase-related protein [Myxococcota bacterium]|nr:acyl-CoA dehydratase activase-related protein [Myxococcota bacterium]
MSNRVVGIDIGAETIKIVELSKARDTLVWTRRALVEHHKSPADALLTLLADWHWNGVDQAAVTGRMSRQIDLPRIPVKQAQASGFRFLIPADEPATVVSIGSHGFSALELRASSLEIFRENSRCSQGTGNFLRQLVERFELTIERASEICTDVTDPAPLSGRCPVILKTDMTHLANKGEPRERILAGLYDAVCENVQVLIKPRISPPRVVLIGGVTRAVRIRENFRRFAQRNGMTLLDLEGDDALYVEALGAAVAASKRSEPVPQLQALLLAPESHPLDQLPPLSEYIDRVKRLSAPAFDPTASPGYVSLIVGYDIGSTGSKTVAVNAETGEPVWQGYVNTNGAPIRAAQELTRQFLASEVADYPVVAVGATGSGREIVGSLMTTCYGADKVFVLNEIAAHAEGAIHYDSRVDTIFEIGGQDAKYIRLSSGRVVDAAMNEACSAGTGSFIEEQGRKFQGISSVVALGQAAVQADFGVSLGQHCSVFMAEIIDEAVAAGTPKKSIIAGIYDSIIQNYLNRVKGSRSVGKVIFCQGMPFAADALAASVVRQTGAEVIVPPNPGTVGALGIGLLARKELDLSDRSSMSLDRFLDAKVLKKDVFICRSKKGCGGAGNKCRIDRIATRVDGKDKKFTWGGGCSLYDKGTGKAKLPDLAPDPFREREALVEKLRGRLSDARGFKRVALTDEFVLKGLFPFFATFIYDLGFDLDFFANADQTVLKRGIEDANVPFCAPMQQYHGVVSAMAQMAPDILFLPMVRNIRRVGDEYIARLCPVVQGSADILRHDLGLNGQIKIVSPVFNFGRENFDSDLFKDSCRSMARELGVLGDKWEASYERAVAVQEDFDRACRDLGKQALAFCKANAITPIVILGRSYTIYNTVLNSNVPAILREQGVVPIPVDCYPVGDEIPIFHNIYWGYGQRNLRAAEHIRKTDGVYSLFCSNYSCGPDSFNIHFYSYIMDGKPYTVIETDGHSGDAGTKTRTEAFLYCVREDQQRPRANGPINQFKKFEGQFDLLDDIRARGATVLIPRMGAGAEAFAACLKGIGVPAEALPLPDRESLALGRRHTSGKECVPMTLTLGSLISRLERSRQTSEQFSFFMPTAMGPCRFGSYNTLQKIIIERLGWQNRVQFWSPIDDDYFEGMDAGFSALVFAGFSASDLLLAALFDARPVERTPGAAQEVYDYYKDELLKQLEKAGAGDLSAGFAMTQALGGQLFGVTHLLHRAAVAFEEVKEQRSIPTVLVVGELYVRCDPFANDFVIRKLEQRGIRGRFAAFTEWLEYTDYQDKRKEKVVDYVTSFLQATIQHQAYLTVAKPMGWHRRTTVQDSLEAARPYIRENLSGEAVLTVGGPVHEWREGHIDGVVSVGPLECMPNKVAESQFFHVAEQEGLISLTLSLNGDPIDPEILDNFAYEVHAQFNRRRTGKSVPPPMPGRRRPSWVPQSKVNLRE